MSEDDIGPGGPHPLVPFFAMACFAAAILLVGAALFSTSQ